YYELARHLGAEQPVYALQAQGLYGKHPPHRRVEEMAAHYIREMKSVQPSGPYYLAGFCFGAIVAYEMAQQLKQQGQETAFLASFDGGVPRFDYYPGPETGNVAPATETQTNSGRHKPRNWVSRHWEKIRGRKPKKIAGYVAKRVSLRWRLYAGRLK